MGEARSWTVIKVFNGGGQKETLRQKWREIKKKKNRIWESKDKKMGLLGRDRWRKGEKEIKKGENEAVGTETWGETDGNVMQSQIMAVCVG